MTLYESSRVALIVGSASSMTTTIGLSVTITKVWIIKLLCVKFKT